MKSRWLPHAMAKAPALESDAIPGPMRRRYALLINPFYRKDPNASFGKHVLTPSLALTATAAATPEHWQLKYWDENLLQGPPPLDPFPEVVAITVHLTFAERAYALADWYRQWGAKVVLGGLHMLTEPAEAAAHADAIAIGEGVHLWPRILADVEQRVLAEVYRGDYKRPYRDDAMPRRQIQRAWLPRKSLIMPLQRCCRRSFRSGPLRPLERSTPTAENSQLRSFPTHRKPATRAGLLCLLRLFRQRFCGASSDRIQADPSPKD